MLLTEDIFKKPLISIILSCYNGERYLNEAIQSFLAQSFQNWEMIFVNDGSFDKSLKIIQSFAKDDFRIKIYSKSNGGLNSARNYGLKFISTESKYIIFSDADDVLDKDFLLTLLTVLENNQKAGAAYCNYKLIDDSGKPVRKDYDCNRYIPTKFWIRALGHAENYTPFISIFTWTPMVEPMTLMRKEMINKYGSWDEINFPKGDTYGESLPLFGEIALNHKVLFVNDELYFYRNHANQITSKPVDIKSVQKKIDRIWEQKILINPNYKTEIQQATIFRDYRLPLPLYLKGSFKHELRFKPIKALKKTFKYCLKYIYSIPFTVRTLPQTESWNYHSNGEVKRFKGIKPQERLRIKK